MAKTTVDRNILTLHAQQSSDPGLSLPEPTWDDSRLLDYMRQHDRAIGGYERRSLQHEFCFGAAAQMVYDQLGGKWTNWAKDQGYPLESFRRRRLLFRRAGSLGALDGYSSKMEAYYDLKIYRRPSLKDLEALDAEVEAEAGVGGAVPEAGLAVPPVTTVASVEIPPAPSEVGGAASPVSLPTESRSQRPKEAVLLDLEERFGKEKQGLAIQLPASSWKLLDLLRAQEEVEDPGQIVDLAVREYWFRHGDPTRPMPEAPGTIRVTA